MITTNCIWCNSTENLEHHHLLPISLGGTDKDLITLCNKCHGKLHNLRHRTTSSELTKRGLDNKRNLTYIIPLIHECWFELYYDDKIHEELLFNCKIYYIDSTYEQMFSYNKLIDKHKKICSEMNIEFNLSKSGIKRALEIYKSDILYYDYICRFSDIEQIRFKCCPLLEKC